MSLTDIVLKDGRIINLLNRRIRENRSDNSLSDFGQRAEFERQIIKFVNGMEPKHDREYFTKRGQVLESLIQDSNEKIIISFDSPSTMQRLEKSSTNNLFVGSHKSMSDFALIPFALYSFGLYPISIAGGTNISNVKPFRSAANFLTPKRNLLGLEKLIAGVVNIGYIPFSIPDYFVKNLFTNFTKKMGLVEIERNVGDLELRAAYIRSQEIVGREILKNGNFIVFAGKGRSKDGTPQKFNTTFTRGAMQAESDFYYVVVNYERVPEAEAFREYVLNPNQEHVSGSANIVNNFAQIDWSKKNPINYIKKLFGRVTPKRPGIVDIEFGYLNTKDLTREQINRLITDTIGARTKISATSLYSLALLQDKQPKEEFIEQKLEEIKYKKIPAFDNILEISPNQIIDRAQLILESHKGWNKKEMARINQGLIRYYANTTSHHFENQTFV